MKNILMIILTVVLVLSSIVYAWGPERETFTMEEPASYPTFNSIMNNPTIGDERDFVRIGEIDADVTQMGNEVEIVPGKQYLVYIYFHNNASSTLNDEEHDNAGVAFQTRMSSTYSQSVKKGERMSVSATITAENSNPVSIWDEAYCTTNYDEVLLNYVEGSAKLECDWDANGSVLPISLFSSEGALIGLNGLDGVVPGCEEYHGVVTYVLQAEEPTEEKIVSTNEQANQGAILPQNIDIVEQSSKNNTTIILCSVIVILAVICCLLIIKNIRNKKQ